MMVLDANHFIWLARGLGFKLNGEVHCLKKFEGSFAFRCRFNVNSEVASFVHCLGGVKKKKIGPNHFLWGFPLASECKTKTRNSECQPPTGCSTTNMSAADGTNHTSRLGAPLVKHFWVLLMALTHTEKFEKWGDTILAGKLWELIGGVRLRAHMIKWMHECLMTWWVPHDLLSLLKPDQPLWAPLGFCQMVKLQWQGCCKVCPVLQGQEHVIKSMGEWHMASHCSTSLSMAVVGAAGGWPAVTCSQNLGQISVNCLGTLQNESTGGVGVLWLGATHTMILCNEHPS